MLSIVTLYFISYLIFIFPFDVLSTWLGNPTSLLEVFITTTLVFSLCLYYFRSKSTNKFIKIFVYEGFGIGAVSFFLILPLIVFEYLKINCKLFLIIKNQKGNNKKIIKNKL